MPKVLLPDRDKLVIEIEKTPTKDQTWGGSKIFKPETAQEKPNSGKVISKGPKCTTIAKEGEIVLFSKFAGTAFESDGKEFVLLDEDDILAVIVDDVK